MSTPPDTPSGSAPSLAAAVLRTSRRARELHARDLAQLHALRRDLQVHATAWCIAGLSFVLQACLASLADLPFERLVPRSLRDTPAPADEEAFSRQVACVTTCAELAWVHVRDLLQEHEANTETLAPPAMAFVMASRAFQREVGACALELASLQQQVADQPQLLGTGRAAEVLRTRLAEARAQLQVLQQASAAATQVQRALYHVADRQRAVHMAVAELAHQLRGGLLDQLTALVEPGTVPAATDLDRAERNRAAVMKALSRLLDRLRICDAAQVGLLERVEGMDMPSGVDSTSSVAG